MIYERMKNIITYYGHTQSQIANVLKVSRSTYAGWENGIDSIILPNLNNFCNYYKVSLDYICGLSNIKEIKLENLEIDKIKLGKDIYFQVGDLKLPICSGGVHSNRGFYIMRGSYHILSNSLRIGWHPEYVQKLSLNENQEERLETEVGN